MTNKKNDPISYVMKKRDNNKLPKYRVPNEKISKLLHKKLKFEGHHSICYICEEPLTGEWCVIRDELVVCSKCEPKTNNFQKKKNEYVEMGLLDEIYYNGD